MNTTRVEASKIIEDSAPALRMQLYVVTSTATSLEDLNQNLEQHHAYQRKLEEQNVLFCSGPLFTDDGQYFEGDGMLIYRAASVEEATAIAQGDPLHSSGARTFKIRPWLLNDGRITVSVTLSSPLRDVF